MSDFQRPHGPQPTRLLPPWDFPGKSNGVGCHCLLRQMTLVPINYHTFFFQCVVIIVSVCVCVLNCIRLFVSHGLQPARLLCAWNFSRQEYWSGLPFPPPGDLPNLGIEPMSLGPPALAGGFFPMAPPGKPVVIIPNEQKTYRWLFSS